MATSETMRLQAELLGAVASIDGRYQDAFQRLQTQVETGDHSGAIRNATECINIVESLMRDYKEHFAANPDATQRYQGDLVTHSGTRSAVRFEYAGAGIPNAEPLLEMAAADVDKALSFPAECYCDPHARSNLLNLKKQIQKARGSGAVAAAKSTGCLVLVAACGVAGLLGAILL